MRPLAVLFLGSVCVLSGQSDSAFGELQGSISDPAGATAPHAAVSLKRSSVGFARQVTTGPDGAYRFLLVPPGEYELEVSREGFESVAFRDVRVAVGAIAPLDVALKLGVRRETIAVTG